MNIGSNTKKLTQGSPLKLILIFALPIFAGNLFQQFYNIADTVIVGHTLGDNALAAVGATSAFYSLIIGFSNGMSNGFSIVIARHFGAGDEDQVKHAIAGTLVIGILSAIFMTIVSLLVIYPLLKFLNTPDIILHNAYLFIRINLAGILITMSYNMASGILRALGNSKTPLTYLIYACIINIGLVYLFIKVFHFGIQGAAAATVISQTISVLLCIQYIVRKCPGIHLTRKDFKISKVMLFELSQTGFSMALMYSIVSIGTIALQSAINQLGTSIITAHAAARKICEIYFLPLSTISTATATFSSQNFGAKLYSRIRAGVLRSFIMGWIWSTFVVLTAYFASPMIIRFLTGSNENLIINTAVTYLRINGPFFYILTILLVLRSTLQSIGRVTIPLFASTIELASKFVTVLVLTPMLGYLGICISEPIIWCICGILVSVVFFTDKRMKKDKFLVSDVVKTSTEPNFQNV